MIDLQDLDLMNDGCLEFAGPGDTLAAWTLRSGTLLAGQLPIPGSTGACFDSHKAPIVTKRRSFRVRLMRFDRPQSRTLSISSDSEAAARSDAIAQAGRDWRIVSISAL